MDHAFTVDANLLPRRLCHVELHPWQVAPVAVVAGQLVVGWVEVGGDDTLTVIVMLGLHQVGSVLQSQVIL